jgi:RimJ/RimL family protein N-acetyltransferase
VRHAAAPQLETERLILRGHRVEDYQELCAIWSDLKVFRHTMGRASTPGEVWHRLLRYSGHWPLLGYGFWAATLKASGEFIGDVGMADFKRDITPSLDGMPEFGWILKSSVHGQGYATEAMRAVDQWSRDNLWQEKICCMISLDNDASIRVAGKLNFEAGVVARYEGNDVRIFTRDRVATPSFMSSPGLSR